MTLFVPIDVSAQLMAAASKGNNIMVSSDSRRDAAANDTVNAPDAASDGRRSIDPQKARQGEIVLKTSAQRWIFFGALGLAAVLGVVIAVLA